MTIAIINGYDELANYLIQCGANTYHTLKDGKNLLHVAALKGRFQMIPKLLGEDGSLLNQQTSSGKTPLYYSCQKSYLLTTETLLLNGARVDIPDVNGVLPIHIACFRQSLLIVNSLCRYDVDIEATTRHGLTPLLFACHFKDWEVVNMLLQNGADVNHSPLNTSPLYTAVKNNRFYIIKVLLRNGAKMDPKTKFLIEKIIQNYLKNLNKKILKWRSLI